MSDPSGRDITDEESREQPVPAEDGLGALRQLLLGEEQNQLAQIQERLEDPELRAEDVSRILPEAILMRTAKDEKLSKALAPVIEDAFQVSVKRNPRVLVDVISPLMGPAIRRSIFQAISGMVQSFNQVLEHSLSIQGLKWRLEAMRTGLPFAEVVLLHTLVYQVEQVFLIHRETGLLLQHVVAGSVKSVDADMVSGMLTAIQDFVHDSFGGEREEELQTMQVGERTVWVEQGPQAVVAGVIRGNPPQELRAVFQEALENIHIEQKEALESFEGDASPFEMIRPHLEECLQSQYRQESREEHREEKKKRSPFLWLVPGAILVAALGFWIFDNLRDSRRWADYLEKLNAEPGIVVTAAGRRNGKYFVSGLRDPLAREPLALLQTTDLEAAAITGAWEPYQSFYPEFVRQRAEQVLRPPRGVDLELEDDLLRAVGTAPHWWIVEARKLARVIPGIARLDEEHLVDAELKELEACREEVEKQVFYFAPGDVRFVSGQEYKLLGLAARLKRLREATRAVGMEAHIEVVGHTDQSGPVERNLQLSQQRAESVVAALILQGFNTRYLTPVGAGAKEPLRTGGPDHDRRINRRVSFKVLLTDTSD